MRSIHAVISCIVLGAIVAGCSMIAAPKPAPAPSTQPTAIVIGQAAYQRAQQIVLDLYAVGVINKSQLQAAHQATNRVQAVMDLYNLVAGESGIANGPLQDQVTLDSRWAAALSP